MNIHRIIRGFSIRYTYLENKKTLWNNFTPYSVKFLQILLLTYNKQGFVIQTKGVNYLTLGANKNVIDGNITPVRNSCNSTKNNLLIINDKIGYDEFEGRYMYC